MDTPRASSPVENAPADDAVLSAKPRKALLRSFITQSSAELREEDMRFELQYATCRARLFTELENRADEIRQLVASHCGLPSSDLVCVSPMHEPDCTPVWLHGSFNVYIPVHINHSRLPATLALRVALPYKLGEIAYPRNVEEKVRSEAATYIWISQNCPQVPIVNLRGFGASSTCENLGPLAFYEPTGVSLWKRIRFYIWRFFHRLNGGPSFSGYFPQRRASLLNHGYLLVDWVENDEVQKLGTQFARPHTEIQIQNLYCDMSRIMISLARLPQPRIGSWTVDNAGRLSLSNRPMLCHLRQLENWAIPSDIPRDRTYTNADGFYLDLLDGHDNRLRYQSNSAFDKTDAQAQAKDLVLMRALLHHFTDSDLREGPFIMQLTDLRSSNIFVDRDWNIKYIIDLEWACSLPLENLRPPCWITNKGIDQLEGPEYQLFQPCYSQFVEVFKEEKAANSPLYHGGIVYYRSAHMKTGLENKHFWYIHALQTPKGLFNLFRTHLQTCYDELPDNDLHDSLRVPPSRFWTPRMNDFLRGKRRDLAQYQQEVRRIFNSRASGELY